MFITMQIDKALSLISCLIFASLRLKSLSRGSQINMIKSTISNGLRVPIESSEEFRTILITTPSN